MASSFIGVLRFLDEEDVILSVKDGENVFVKYSSIIFGCFLAFFLLNVLNSSYSTVLEMIKTEFNLTYTMSGALMSSYFVGYMVGQIP